MRKIFLAASVLLIAPQSGHALTSHGEAALAPVSKPASSTPEASSTTIRSAAAGSAPARKALAPLPSSSSNAAKGINCLKRQQYKLAAYHLRLALDADPTNAHLHYYYANALVHLRKHHEAIDSYRQSYELDPYSTVSGFCRQALLTYNVSVPFVDPKLRKKTASPLPSYKEGSPQNKPWQSKPEQEVSTENEDSSAETEAAKPQQKIKEYSFREHHVNNATAMIRRQAADEKARKRDFADKLAGSEVSVGNAKANKIRAEAEEQIKELYEGPMLYDSQGNARGRGVPAWRLSPVLQDYLKERAEQIRREADAKAQLEISVSGDRSNQYKKWYMEREDDLDSVSDSLESQLNKNGSRSGVSLNPVGTGLYVRNYSTFKPKHPIPEAHSSVVRILDRGFEEGDSKQEFKEPPLRFNKVSGKVVSE
jgi:tetratricopeptide (TPR) repeat protein